MADKLKPHIKDLIPYYGLPYVSNRVCNNPPTFLGVTYHCLVIAYQLATIITLHQGLEKLLN